MAVSNGSATAGRGNRGQRLLQRQLRARIGETTYRATAFELPVDAFDLHSLPWTPSHSTALNVGVELGKSSALVVITDNSQRGSIIFRAGWESPDAAQLFPEKQASKVVALVHQVLTDSSLARVREFGVILPSIVPPSDLAVVLPTGLDFDQDWVGQKVAEKLGEDVRVTTGSGLEAAGRYALGALPSKDFIALQIGGVVAGVVPYPKPAMELGHVDHTLGQVETHSILAELTPDSVVRRFTEQLLTRGWAPSLVREAIDGDPKKITPALIDWAALQGDNQASAFVLEDARQLAEILLNEVKLGGFDSVLIGKEAFDSRPALLTAALSLVHGSLSAGATLTAYVPGGDWAIAQGAANLGG